MRRGIFVLLALVLVLSACQSTEMAWLKGSDEKPTHFEYFAFDWEDYEHRQSAMPRESHYPTRNHQYPNYDWRGYTFRPESPDGRTYQDRWHR